MFGSRIKLEKDLLLRCKRYAKKAGYSSVEEFVSHALELELRQREAKAEEGEERVLDRLKGLGYIE